MQGECVWIYILFVPCKSIFSDSYCLKTCMNAVLTSAVTLAVPSARRLPNSAFSFR